MIDVHSIGEALPSAHRRHRRVKPSTKPMPASLPACFEDVWRRRHSEDPRHRNERAALEAVASTIPPDAASLTGQSAAGVYLAALVLSLQRLVSTTAPSAKSTEPGLSAGKPLSRKEKKMLRRREREIENALQEMPAAVVLGGKDSEMDRDGQMDVEATQNADNDNNSDDETELVANLMYLISLAAHGSSQAVLNAKCETILQVTMAAYDHVRGAPIIARHTSAVLATTLATLDSSSWSKPAVQRAYLNLLRLTCDADPRSRRRAREALDTLLRSQRAGVIRARTSSSAATHFVAELKLQASAMDTTVNGDSVLDNDHNPAVFLHLLTSLERFAIFLAPLDASRVAKQVILVAAMNLPNISGFGFQVLTSLFKHRLEASKDNPRYEEPLAFLPQGDLGNLLQALLKLQLPGKCPHETLSSYHICISQGAIAHALHFRHSGPSDEFVLRPVQKLCDFLDPTAGRTDVSRIVCANLGELFKQKWFRGRPRILALLQSFTSTTYRVLWPEITPLLKHYLEDQMMAGNSQAEDTVRQLVKSIIVARENAMNAKDMKAQDMTSTVISGLVRGGGARHLLRVCELRYDEKLHITNAWLLPVLRDGLCGAPLSLFPEKLIPVADRLQEVMSQKELQKRPVESKNMAMYLLQVWELFPGFCNKPVDLGQEGVFNTAFRTIHRCLSSGEHFSMQTVGIGALRQLSSSILALDAEDPITVARQQSFGSRLKKLFPTVFSVTEETPDDKRAVILEAVSLACRATGDPALVANILRKSIRRLLELQVERSTGQHQTGSGREITDRTVRQQHAAADLAIAIAESRILPSDATEVKLLEKAISPFFLDAKESSLQKKAYKATTLLIDSESMTKAQEDLFTLATNVAGASTSVASGAKAARQGLITALVNHHLRLSVRAEKVALLQHLTDLFLSEVVLGTRDPSEKTRASSFETLVALARGWNSTSVGTDALGLRQFFLAVAAGLGGRTASMVSATLTSLGRLMYDFQGEASSDSDLSRVIDSMFASVVSNEGVDQKMVSLDDEREGSSLLIQPGPIAILLRHDALEVQKSALGVVKVATKVLSKPPARLTGILRGIMPGLVHAAAHSKKQEVRLRVRIILERLLRKCGREAVEDAFPREHMKLLGAVRKKYSRELVKKHAARERKREIMASRESAKSFALTLVESDGSEEFDIDDSDSDIERELVDGDELISFKARASGEKDGALHMKETKGEVVDLLDSRNSHSVLTEGEVKEAARVARKEKRRQNLMPEGDVVKYTDDGRPIFVESDAGSGEAEVGSVVNDDSGDSSSDTERHAQKRSNGTGSRKRSRGNSNDAYRHTKKSKGSFGEEYRSKKGLGDVKRPGRPDPYAYIPLGTNLLSSSVKPSISGGKGKKGSKLRGIAGSRHPKRRGVRLGVPGKR